MVHIYIYGTYIYIWYIYIYVVHIYIYICVCVFGLWLPFTSVHHVQCLGGGPRRPLLFSQHTSALQLLTPNGYGVQSPELCEPDRRTCAWHGGFSQTLPLISDIRPEITYACNAGKFHPAPSKSQNFMGGQKPLLSSPYRCFVQPSFFSQPQLKPLVRSARSISGTSGMPASSVSSWGSSGLGVRFDQGLLCRWGHHSAAIARTESTIGLVASPLCWPGWGTS